MSYTRPMPAIAVIGSIVADIVVQTPRLPRSGENLHAKRIRVMPGGKAANAAVAFTRLGGRAYLLGNTGSDAFAAMARQALEQEGVSISTVRADPEHPTGSGILLVEATGQTAFIIDPGANLTLPVAWVEEALRPLLPVLDGLLFNFEAPEACLLRAVELARAHNLPVFVDAGPARPYTPVLWQGAAVLTPNQAEAEAMVGYSLAESAAAEQAARQLLEQGARTVVLKMGGRGALVAQDRKLWWSPAFPVQVVDSAGDGDAFTAGLVLALLEGRSLADAVVYANACGAIAAARAGTMVSMPTAAEVAALLRGSRV
ncbi:MAG: ribokinase [Caldilineae bacterium]|nr:MAG: ribokinase [Caldilineae bacterium]